MKTLAQIYSMICGATYKTAGDDVQYVVYKDDTEKRIYCLFKESNSKNDWRNNFNFPVKLYKDQEGQFLVARGWGNVYKSANDEVMADVMAELTDYEYSVYFCGWSFGGAMAQLAAEDFHYRYGEYPYVITYGSPKVIFGKRSREHFKIAVAQAFNVQHVNDCIPSLPPFPGYCVINPCTVGGKFSLRGFFNPWKYHCMYGDESIY